MIIILIILILILIIMIILIMILATNMISQLTIIIHMQLIITNTLIHI